MRAPQDGGGAGATGPARLGHRPPAPDGYAVADVVDVAPGVLTRDRPAAAPRRPRPARRPRARPLACRLGRPGAHRHGRGGARPTAAGLQSALAGASDDPALEGGLGVSVRDGITGGEIWALDPDRARVPASTVKLLSALAVADGLDLGDTMTTGAVAAPGSTEVVLVASRGHPPCTREGQTRRRWRAGRAWGTSPCRSRPRSVGSGRTTVDSPAGPRLRPGAALPRVLEPQRRARRVHAGCRHDRPRHQLPRAGRPAPPEPEQEVAEAFAAALAGPA